MVRRRPQNQTAASSTDGVVSDDGSAVATVLNRSRRNGDNCSSLAVDDDGESLFVNGTTERGSDGPYSPATGHGHGHNHGHGHGHGHNNKTKAMGALFGRLSKSAVKLLSQDDQTLSQLLSVEMGEGGNNNMDLDMDMDLDVNAVAGESTRNSSTINTRTNNANMNSETTRTRINDMSARNNTNNGSNYSYRVRELEIKLQEKDKEITAMNTKWEKKLEDIKTQLEHKHEAQIKDLQSEISQLRGQLKLGDENKSMNKTKTKSVLDGHEKEGKDEIAQKNENMVVDADRILQKSRVSRLTADQLSRYSRQLLLHEGWGVDGQLKLLSSSVLVIGAGGIGSSLLLYLASAGVGNITVVDFDVVDMSNLHRQVIHTEGKVGMNKAISACQAMKELNPTINCTPVTEVLNFVNAMELVSKHDCVVDACDNPQTRYLVNDACVLNGKPLVSGSAMCSEGQLTVYNFNDSGCYRCLYPKINSAEGSKSCSDNGVIGSVPGLIGILQATETLKLLTSTGTIMHDRLLMYDALRCSFMSVKKPPRRKNCTVCGPDATISNMNESKISSSKARGPQQCDLLPVDSLPAGMNVTCQDYYQIRRDNVPHVLLDVRVKRQYDLCSLEGAVNIELSSLREELQRLKDLSDEGTKPVFCLCRRGIASTEAVKILSSSSLTSNKICNIKGGLNAWVKTVDPSFPMY